MWLPAGQSLVSMVWGLWYIVEICIQVGSMWLETFTKERNQSPFYSPAAVGKI